MRSFMRVSPQEPVARSGVDIPGCRATPVEITGGRCKRKRGISNRRPPVDLPRVRAGYSRRRRAQMSRAGASNRARPPPELLSPGATMLQLSPSLPKPLMGVLVFVDVAVGEIVGEPCVTVGDAGVLVGPAVGVVGTALGVVGAAVGVVDPPVGVRVGSPPVVVGVAVGLPTMAVGVVTCTVEVDVATGVLVWTTVDVAVACGVAVPVGIGVNVAVASAMVMIPGVGSIVTG